MKRRRARVPRMSDDDLKAFVMGYCSGLVVTSTMVPKDLLPLVFMPMALGGAADVDTKTLGLIWEFSHARGTGLAVNGWPIFASARLMHRLDVVRAQKAIDRELARRAEVRV